MTVGVDSVFGPNEVDLDRNTETQMASRNKADERHAP